MLESGVLLLFRGQGGHFRLYPKIARNDPSQDTTVLDRKMLGELSRRLASNSDFTTMSEWDKLVYVQHYGLAIRLLDWTTNLLVALWFACSDLDETNDGIIYMIVTTENMFLGVTKDRSPFDLKRTKIWKPNIHNSRIVSQNGWFTVHRCSKKKILFAKSIPMILF